MTTYKDELDQARRALRPPEDAYEQLLKRRDRKRRNRRIAAGIVALLIFGGFLFAIATLSRRNEHRPASSACVPIPADLTHWWPADGNGADAIGGLAATLHGNATYGPGRVGRSFMLGGDGDFVSVPDDAQLDIGTADFTVALWVNFASTEGEQILAEKWVQRSFDPEIVDGWTLTKLPDDHIGFAIAEGLSADSEPLDIPLGTWIHFAARRRGEAIQILMNGEVIASRSTPNREALDVTSGSSLKFGHRGAPADTPGSISDQQNYLHGRIDDVRLMIGRALSNREIRAIVKAGTGTKRC